jgi:hypothetical protein
LRVLPALLLLLLLLAMLAVALVPPVAGGFYPPCPFHAVTGLLCPGCGTARGLHALLQGQILQALAWNPLMVLLLPVLLLELSRQGLARLRGRPPPRDLLRHPRVGYALLGVILAFWFLRNLPFHPFTLLAPHPL